MLCNSVPEEFVIPSIPVSRLSTTDRLRTKPIEWADRPQCTKCLQVQRSRRTMSSRQSSTLQCAEYWPERHSSNCTINCRELHLCDGGFRANGGRYWETTSKS